MKSRLQIVRGCTVTAPSGRGSESSTRLQAGAEDRGQRLDHYLQRQLPDYSRSRLQSWVKQGRVLVDGVSAKPSALLRGTESIEVEPAELPPLKAFAEELPLQILYEDPSVVA
ncbi:MAG: hypothetical protein GY953_43600, partial [bacterium]|nr:hypothetical protein [bacterium]